MYVPVSVKTADILQVRILIRSFKEGHYLREKKIPAVMNLSIHLSFKKFKSINNNNEFLLLYQVPIFPSLKMARVYIFAND